MSNVGQRKSTKQQRVLGYALDTDVGDVNVSFSVLYVSSSNVLCLARVDLPNFEMEQVDAATITRQIHVRNGGANMYFLEFGRIRS